jgi:hypothetical protein
MSKKKMQDWLMYVSFAIFGVAGINALLKVLNVSYPLIDEMLVLLGFFGFLALVYGINKFKFRSLLDLTLLSVIVGILGFISSGALVSSSWGLVSQIYSGFAPLLTGLVIAGVITILVGMVNLKTLRK